jgi:hypothetical protein
MSPDPSDLFAAAAVPVEASGLVDVDVDDMNGPVKPDPGE